MEERGVQKSNSRSHSSDITEPLGIQSEFSCQSELKLSSRSIVIKSEYSYQVRNQVL